MLRRKKQLKFTLEYVTGLLRMVPTKYFFFEFCAVSKLVVPCMEIRVLFSCLTIYNEFITKILYSQNKKIKCVRIR